MKITISEAEGGLRLDKVVTAAVPGLGRAGAKRLFEEGKVRVASAGSERSRRGQKGDVAAAGDVVEIELDPGAGEGAVPDPEAPLALLLERPDLVVANKRAGQPTAPLNPGERGTLANALLARFPEMGSFGFSPREPGLVHRLDTDTTGCVLAARTREAFEALSSALRQGRIDKRYLAVCRAEDLPESGSIDFPITPHPKDRRRVYPCIHPRDVARYAPRPAHTEYSVLRRSGDLALVEVRAAKAFRHQIRAHFAAIEHPLIGDALYGGEPREGLARHALHAAKIAWSGDAAVPAFSVECPLPEDMEALVRRDG